MTNNGPITSQIGCDCSYAAPIAQNEEKVLVRTFNFSPDRDFIVFRYIFICELMKRKVWVESEDQLDCVLIRCGFLEFA